MPRTSGKFPVVRLRIETAISALSFSLLFLMGCGPRRVNVMFTTHETMMAVGYSADRSSSILRANNDAQEYCQRKRRDVMFIQQDTIYQGRYPEDVTATTRTAGRVAGALGSPKVARASRSLSSPTDYKTTFEFRCK